MLTALSTGHDGSLCTVHAGTRRRGAAAARDARADGRRRPAARRDPRAGRRRDRPRRLPGPRRRRQPPRRPRSPRSCASREAPAAREIYTLARRPPDLARPARRRPRGAAGAGMSRERRALARRRGRAARRRPRRVGVPRDGGGRARVADRLALALAPLARARREGRAPSGAERRRLALLAAGSLLAGGWLLGGPLARRARRRSPARRAVLALVRARRGPLPGRGSAAGAAGAARALADAIGGGPLDPRRAGRGRARRCRARRATSCAVAARALDARRADRGGARAPARRARGCARGTR